jgi:hypothetical protein
MDDFDTDFKNPIGIFNPENGSKLDLHMIHKVDHRLIIFVNNQITTANPAPFHARNFAPSGGRRDCVF